MIVIFFFIIGLFFGSFFLVVIDRFGSEETFIQGRSRCDHCKKELSAIDLIPVLSFLSTGGRCRYCRVKLSWSYPLFELLTGVLFGFTAFYVGSMLQTQYLVFSIWYFAIVLFYLFISSCLLLIFFIDLKYGIIPFAIIFPAILITFVYLLLTSYSLLPSHLLSGVVAFFFFFFLFMITKGRGMGFGDVVYVFFMGLLLGYPNIFAGMYIAFLSGASISLVLVYLKKKKLRGSTIPFGPFLVAGTFIGWIWGEQLIRIANNFLLGL